MDFKKIRIVKMLLLGFFMVCFFVIAISLKHNIAPVFSVESGFYDEPFYLEIGEPGEKIFYTLDCSEPTENSLLYTEPILISDATDQENVYSSIPDISPLLNRELIELGLVADYGYVVPVEPVDKATIVRAISIDVFGNKSDVSTGVFFVGFGSKQSYEGMSIVSIVTDPNNLFDFETGIYVDGMDYERFIASTDITEDNDYTNWTVGNYRRRGKDARRKALITLFDQDRKIEWNNTVEISIQGGGARAWIPKNFNVYSSGNVDTSFADGISVLQKSFNLTAGGQDRNIKIRNRLTNELIKDLKICSRSYIPCVLFLEGEYWGTYYLTERFDKSYFLNRYDVSENDVVMIKTGYLEIGKESDKELYNNMVKTVAALDLSNNDNYALASSFIDIESFIDYYATEIYIANLDWLPTNIALWRSKEKGDGEYNDARWRYIIYDVDGSMETAEYNYDLERAIQKDPVFASFMNNEVFSKMMKQRLVFLAENVFSPSIVNSAIDKYQTELQGAMQKEYMRYYGDNKDISYFNNGCEQIKAFFEKRYEYVMTHYGDSGL